MTKSWYPTGEDVESWMHSAASEPWWHRTLVVLDVAANTIFFSRLRCYTVFQTMSSHFGLARLAGSQFGAAMSWFLSKTFSRHHVWKAMAGDLARDQASEAVESKPLPVKEENEKWESGAKHS